MELHPQVTMERLVDACERDDCEGFCMYCGEIAYGVEPDARRYRCEACGQFAVYGAEELLIRCVTARVGCAALRRT